MERSQYRRPHSIQVFLICQSAGTRSYLLLQRQGRPELALPAFWQGITGALEQGETHADAAIREVFEETSISLRSVIEAGFSYSFPIKPEWRKSYGPVPSHVEEQVFYALVPEQISPVLTKEHQLWHWCPVEEAEQLLTFGVNRECLQAVEKHIVAAEVKAL